MSVAGVRNYHVKHYDVKSAFLHGEIEEEIYMKQPPGFGDGNKVCRLRKSLFGLKQAARVWNLAIDGALTECGCVASEVDKCLYTYHADNKTVYVIIHVDDILIEPAMTSTP